MPAPPSTKFKKQCIIAPAAAEEDTSLIDGKFEELHGLVAFINRSTPVIVMPDTAAEVSVINEKLVKKEWAQPTSTKGGFAGVQEFKSTVMKGERTVHIQLGWGSDMIHLDLRPSCSAMSDLKGADILLGLPGLRELDATIECSQKLIFLTHQKHGSF